MGARSMLILCLVLEGIPFASMSLADTYVMIGVCSAFSGIGYGFINQVSTKGIMNWFSPAMRATAMGLKQSGVVLGAAAAAWLLPVLAVAYNWKASTWTVGISMFVMAFLAFAFYRELPPGDCNEKPVLKKSQGGESLLMVLSQPTLLALLLIIPFLAFSQGCVVSFLVLYLKEHVHFPVELAGKCMTASMITAALGRVTWGVVSDRIFRGDRLKPVIIMSLIGAVSALGMGLLSRSSPVWLAFFWSILLGFSLSGWNAIVMVLSAELGGLKLAASVVSVLITVIGIGFLIGPIVFGYVADHAGYFSSWLVVVIASLVSVGGFVYIYSRHR
jgi:sugar phosphate permease